MAEYIDKEKFCHFLFKEIAHFEETQTDIEIPISATLQSVVNEVKKFPSADVQPVLRCKDCKEWHRNYLAIDGGKHGCELFQDFTRPDDFCSFGRRMDGET